MGFGLGNLNPSNWSIGGTSVGSLVTKGRDATEAAIAAPLNMVIPGSTNWTQKYLSKGGKALLNTGTGRAATDTLSAVGIGAGLVGGAALAAPYVGTTAAGTSASSGDAALYAGTDAAGAVGAQAPAYGGATSYGTDIAASDAAATGGTTGSGAAAGTAAGGMSTAQKVLLGLAGINALGQKKQPLNPNLVAGATPAQTTSNKILDQYNSGQLNAADQYSIAKWAQDTKAAKQEYYAKAGLADSSMAQQDIAQIDAQAGAMRDQALQNMLQGGLNAAGIANTATGNAVSLQIQQDQQAQQAQQQFFAMLAYTMA